MKQEKIPNRSIFIADNLEVMRRMPDECIDLIATDPPFNTLKDQKGIKGEYEDTWRLGKTTKWEEWDDIDSDYKERIKPILVLASNNKWIGDDEPVDYNKWSKKEQSDYAFVLFITLRAIQMHRILKDTGSLYWHCDWKMNYYIRLVLDVVFGKQNLRNEIVWRMGWVSGYKTQKKGWIRNHDTIFYYTKTDKAVEMFNKEYIPYPKGYVRRDGKKPTGKGIPYEDTWNCSNADILNSVKIQSFSKEKIGYATEKPVKMYRRIIRASSNKGDMVLDPFAGCTTTCIASEIEERQWIGIDINKDIRNTIIEKMEKAGGLETRNEGFDFTEKRYNDFFDKLLVFEGKKEIGDVLGGYKDIPTKKDEYRTVEAKRARRQELFDNDESKKKNEDGQWVVKCKGYTYPFMNRTERVECGEYLTFKHFELDRIIAGTKGGKYTKANTQILCGSCNGRKNNR